MAHTQHDVAARSCGFPLRSVFKQTSVSLAAQASLAFRQRTRANVATCGPVRLCGENSHRRTRADISLDVAVHTRRSLDCRRIVRGRRDRSRLVARQDRRVRASSTDCSPPRPRRHGARYRVIAARRSSRRRRPRRPAGTLLRRGCVAVCRRGVPANPTCSQQLNAVRNRGTYAGLDLPDSRAASEAANARSDATTWPGVPTATASPPWATGQGA